MKHAIFGAFLAFSIIAFSGCGKGGQSRPADSSAAPGYGNSGTVNTQYGCLPQGNCPAGQALYGNQCIYATGGSNPCGNPFTSNPYGAPNGGYGVPYSNWGGGPYYPVPYPGYPNQNTGSICPSPYLTQGNYCVYYYTPWQYTFYPMQ